MGMSEDTKILCGLEITLLPAKLSNTAAIEPCTVAAVVVVCSEVSTSTALFTVSWELELLSASATTDPCTADAVAGNGRSPLPVLV